MVTTSDKADESGDDAPSGKRIHEIDDDVAALEKGGRHAVEHEQHHHRLDHVVGTADRAVEYVAQKYVEHA